MTAPHLGIALFAAALAALAACGGVADAPVPALLRLSDARLAALTAAEEADAAGPAAADPASYVGPAGFATSEDVARFLAECDQEQPALREPGGQHRGAGLTPYGQIHVGSVARKLAPMPDDNVFRWVEGNPEFLDPNKISESSGTAIASPMFEPLLVPAPGNTPPRPGQAERWEVSEDGLTYTFHLRPGLVWSDGTPIDADTFRRSWLRGLAPETASKNAEQLWYIAGAKAYNTGKGPVDDVAIRADGLTLTVRLASPAPFFIDLVTYVAYAPVPHHVIAEHGNRWTRPEHIVVNGPFLMTEWTPRDRLVMTKNPRYWDADSVALDGTIIFSSDSESRNAILYDTGQIHYAKPLNSDDVERWIAEGRSDLHIDEYMCTYYYVLNTTRPPFDDRRVRRAFNMAIDKARLTRHVLSSFQRPARGILSDAYRDTLGYQATPGDDHDPTGARRLLAEAGYADAASLPPMSLVYNTFEGHRLIAEFVGNEWQQHLGADVKASNMEWKSLLKTLNAGDYQIGRASWCADYPDPMTFLAGFHSESPNNDARYHNPAYDELLAGIRAERDKRRRNVLICAAEKTLNRDVPLIPFYFYTRSYLLRPEVKGFAPQYQDRHALKWIRLEPAGGAGEGAP